jgi:hypothetical protein
MFGSVFLAEDPSNGKQYVVKECVTKDKSERVQKLLWQEPKNLEKVKKYKHPNLQNLITWFYDPFGTIVSIIEYKKGQTLV